LHAQISRQEICEELGISEDVLLHYENFLEVPQTGDGYYPLSVGKIFGRIHELISKGLSFSQIRTLSFFAEEFKELVPALRPYEELSPVANYREAIQHYQGIIQGLQEREMKYQESILEYQDQIEKISVAAEENSFLKDKLNSMQLELEKYKIDLSHREDQIRELQAKLTQVELQAHELYYQVATKDSMISRLKTQIEGGELPELPRTAIDIDSLLKKKEREIEIKHQRKILDLKKEFESVVAKKEKEWLKTLQQNKNTLQA